MAAGKTEVMMDGVEMMMFESADASDWIFKLYCFKNLTLLRDLFFLLLFPPFRDFLFNL